MKNFLKNKKPLQGGGTNEKQEASENQEKGFIDEEINLYYQSGLQDQSKKLNQLMSAQHCAQHVVDEQMNLYYQSGLQKKSKKLMSAQHLVDSTSICREIVKSVLPQLDSEIFNSKLSHLLEPYCIEMSLYRCQTVINVVQSKLKYDEFPNVQFSRQKDSEPTRPLLDKRLVIGDEFQLQENDQINQLSIDPPPPIFPNKKNSIQQQKRLIQNHLTKDQEELQKIIETTPVAVYEETFDSEVQNLREIKEKTRQFLHQIDLKAIKQEQEIIEIVKQNQALVRGRGDNHQFTYDFDGSLMATRPQDVKLKPLSIRTTFNFNKDVKIKPNRFLQGGPPHPPPHDSGERFQIVKSNYPTPLKEKFSKYTSPQTNMQAIVPAPGVQLHCNLILHDDRNILNQFSQRDKKYINTKQEYSVLVGKRGNFRSTFQPNNTNINNTIDLSATQTNPNFKTNILETMIINPDTSSQMISFIDPIPYNNRLNKQSKSMSNISHINVTAEKNIQEILIDGDEESVHINRRYILPSLSKPAVQRPSDKFNQTIINGEQDWGKNADPGKIVVKKKVLTTHASYKGALDFKLKKFPRDRYNNMNSRIEQFANN